MREQGREHNDLLQRLAADPRLGLSQQQLASALEEPLSFVGTAPEQVQAFVAQVQPIVSKYPEAAKYQPEPML
jgi:adenylosuccinate lyase